MAVRKRVSQRQGFKTYGRSKKKVAEGKRRLGGAGSVVVTERLREIRKDRVKKGSFSFLFSFSTASTSTASVMVFGLPWLRFWVTSEVDPKFRKDPSAASSSSYGAYSGPWLWRTSRL